MSELLGHFQCKRCQHVIPNARTDDLKLLTTKVSGLPYNPEWTIITCPNCKDSQTLDKKNPWSGKPPYSHISAPKPDTK